MSETTGTAAGNSLPMADRFRVLANEWDALPQPTPANLQIRGIHSTELKVRTGALVLLAWSARALPTHGPFFETVGEFMARLSEAQSDNEGRRSCEAVDGESSHGKRGFSPTTHQSISLFAELDTSEIFARHGLKIFFRRLPVQGRPSNCCVAHSSKRLFDDGG